MAETAHAAPPRPSRSETRRFALGAVLLAALSVALYATTADFDFISYDDRVILLAHPELYDVGSPVEAFQAIFLEHLPREEPLLVRDLTWWIDARLFGFETARGYHVGNVFYNALAVVLFSGWLLTLRRRFLDAFLPALVFAVLPIHVEAVAWVMGRKDLLSACFSFAILIAHALSLRLERQPGRARARWLAYALTIALYPLAVLSKFNALFIAPILMLQALLFPYLTGERAPGAPLSRRDLRRAVWLIPHLGLAVALYAFYSWDLTAMRVITDRGPPATSAEHLGTLAAFLPWVLALYVRNMVSASELSITYPWPDVEQPIGPALMAGGGAIVTIVVLAAYLLGRHRRDLFFFFAAFFVAMIPYANLVYIGIWVADRYAYLSSGMLATLAVWGIADLVRRARADGRAAGIPTGRGVGAIAAGALMISLGVFTYGTLDRVPVFRDDLHLYGHEVTLTAPSVSAYTSLVRAELREVAHAPLEERARWLPVIEAHIAEGLARYESTPRRRRAHYLVGNHLSYSQLLVFSTLTMSMRGASAEERLPTLFRAHEVCPRADSAGALAGVLREAADETDDAALRAQRLRLSLLYFAERARMELAMPNVTEAKRASLREELHRAYGDAAALAPEVRDLDTELGESTP